MINCDLELVFDFYLFRSVPVYFIWLKYLSWFKYGFEAMLVNQWDSFGSIGNNIFLNLCKYAPFLY